MDWEIVSFVGMGPIRFGMTPSEVEAVLGLPLAVDDDDDDPSYRKEVREIDVPTVTYEDNKVAEIEAFDSVKNVRISVVNLFEQAGPTVLKNLETLNKGALTNVGIVLFENLGITTGRLDSDVALERSVTAFKKGHWDDSMKQFKKISFI